MLMLWSDFLQITNAARCITHRDRPRTSLNWTLPVTAGMGSGDPLPPLNPKLKKQLKHFLEWMLPSSKVQLDNWSQSFQISVILLSVVLHLIFILGWNTGRLERLESSHTTKLVTFTAFPHSEWLSTSFFIPSWLRWWLWSWSWHI